MNIHRVNDQSAIINQTLHVVGSLLRVFRLGSVEIVAMLSDKVAQRQQQIRANNAITTCLQIAKGDILRASIRIHLMSL